MYSSKGCILLTLTWISTTLTNLGFQIFFAKSVLYCTEQLRQNMIGKRSRLKLGMPIIWGELRNHHNNYYLCLVNLHGNKPKPLWHLLGNLSIIQKMYSWPVWSFGQYSVRSKGNILEIVLKVKILRPNKDRNLKHPDSPQEFTFCRYKSFFLL